jgi:PadR family transcriptional regulator, regulatory protein AphA
MELSNTAYVILGALHERARSGYDIKAFADASTRHFWAVSYGQLYPELKRLLDAGLIEAEDQPTGSRQRTLYRLTRLGEEALADWVSDTGTRPCEIRDEMLVRLFFSDAVEREKRVELAGNMAARHRAQASGLRKQSEGKPAHRENAMHDEVLQFGIDLHEHLADWYARLAARLENE